MTAKVHLSTNDFQSLNKSLSDLLFAVDPRAFVVRVLGGSPRASDIRNNLNTNVAPNTLSTLLIDHLINFGQDVPGRETLALLIDQMKREQGVQDIVALDRLVRKYGLISGATLPDIRQGPGRPAYEVHVKQQFGIADYVAWTTALAQVSRQVCFIDTPTGTGTGFLVSTDAVITNQHVVDDLLAKPNTASTVTLSFDYRGNSTGEVHKLHSSDWHIASSPPDYPADAAPSVTNQADPSKLDFALLRLATKPGEQRGWITVKKPTHDFEAERQIYIAQHPSGRPLSLAIDSDAIVEVNGNNSRVRYRTNTEPGSSGSPCFDKDWNWVALHHSGDQRVKPFWNEGIPAETILTFLTAKGITDVVTRSGRLSISE